MRPCRILSVCVLISLMGTEVACRKQDTPTQVAVWTGRPGNLGQWGHSADYVYGVLGQPDSKEDLLVVWQWQGDSLKETSPSPLPHSMYFVPATEGICGLCLRKDDGSWPYALVRLQDGKVLKEWSPPPDWSFRAAGGSMNGKFIGLVVTDDVDAPGYDSENRRARVGLIDVEKKALDWVADLNGHGEGTMRTVIATDDGRYVAVAGWNNGTAMADTKESKILWAKCPENEVSTGYAAFAPDGTLIYTAGSEGCVYGIEVTTGNVVSQRWATTTGKSIYAHRVSSLGVSNDGKWVAAGTGPEGEVYVWNVKANDPPRVLHHGQGSISIVAVSPDGTKLASVGGGALKVWQLEEKREEKGLPATRPAEGGSE